MVPLALVSIYLECSLGQTKKTITNTQKDTVQVPGQTYQAMCASLQFQPKGGHSHLGESTEMLKTSGLHLFQASNTWFCWRLVPEKVVFKNKHQVFIPGPAVTLQNWTTNLVFSLHAYEIHLQPPNIHTLMHTHTPLHVHIHTHIQTHIPTHADTEHFVQSTTLTASTSRPAQKSFT